LDAVLAEAAATVVAGGTLVFPTDTVYGIGGSARRLDAVARIFELKRRPREKPLALHLGSLPEALEFAAGNPLATRVMRALLPGPVTIVVARPPSVDPLVTGGNATVGVRVPGHALCVALCTACGPLAATSANESGRPSFKGDGSIADLPDADLAILDGPTPLRGESTVIDVTGKQIRVIREGMVPVARLEEQFGSVVR
jgi:L-threonylcarbamoyladenylate synthase